MFWVLAKFHKGMPFVEVAAKNKNQCSKIPFLPQLPRIPFPYETWQALKTLVKVCHQKNLEFLHFFDFTIHAKIIWAKTEMGTGQHFFHECKWHAHIGDAFLNILISYLNFSELVWNFYEVFKVMVKRSKGKSIRGAKWLGQNRWLLGIRGKTDEWDTTRGINLIIP